MGSVALNKELNNSSGFFARYSRENIRGRKHETTRYKVAKLGQPGQTRQHPCIETRHEKQQQRVNTDNQVLWYKSEQVRSVGS